VQELDRDALSSAMRGGVDGAEPARAEDAVEVPLLAQDRADAGFGEASGFGRGHRKGYLIAFGGNERAFSPA
jgi:hypothetical protein